MDLEPWLSGSAEESWVAQAQPVENDVDKVFFKCLNCMFQA